MAVKFKQKNPLSVLTKLGVGPFKTNLLKKVHATLLVGETDVQINAQGKTAVVDLPLDAINLINTLANYSADDLKYNTIAIFAKTKIEEALVPLFEGVDTSDAIPPEVKPAAKAEAKPVDAVIFLRDAKALHQKVKGSSAESVYVAVAINDNTKVAARISGQKLSVRVEGVLSPFTVDSFTKLGFDKKVAGGLTYLSNHFTCNESATPDKVLGAVLIGCGIKFHTQLPDVSKVREYSK